MNNISIRKQNFHKQIRKQQLCQIFTKKRAQLNIQFVNTNQRSTLNTLIDLLKSEEITQTQLIQIGNYIVDNKHDVKYFQPFFIPIRIQHLTYYQSWIISLIVLLNKQYSNYQDYDKAVSLMINNSNAKIIKNGLLCYDQLLEIGLNENYLWKETRTTFLDYLHQIDVQSIPLPFLELIFSIMIHNIQICQLFSISKVGKIIHKSLQQLTHTRQEVLGFISFYTLNISKVFDNVMIAYNEFLTELYFLSSCSSYSNKVIIFNILGNLIQQISLSDVSHMMRIGLLECLVGGLNQQDEVCGNALKAIQILLKKFKESQEVKLFKYMIVELQKFGFDIKIQKLYNSENNKKRKESLEYIVDSLYSQQVL